MKKLDAKMLAEAKSHYEALADIAEEAGMPIEALMNKLIAGPAEESADMEEDADDSEEKPAMDKGKVALLVAKMKGMKAEE